MKPMPKAKGLTFKSRQAGSGPVAGGGPDCGVYTGVSRPNTSRFLRKVDPPANRRESLLAATSRPSKRFSELLPNDSL